MQVGQVRRGISTAQGKHVIETDTEFLCPPASGAYGVLP